MHEVVRTTTLPWLRVVSAGSVTDARRTTPTSIRSRSRRDGRAARARARARLRGDRRHAAGTRAGRSPGARVQPARARPAAVRAARAPDDDADSSRYPSVARENSGLTLDGILLTMVEAGNPASERVAKYVREQLPAGLVLDLVIPRTRRRSKRSRRGSRSCCARPRTRRRRRIAPGRVLAGRLE